LDKEYSVLLYNNKNNSVLFHNNKNNNFHCVLLAVTLRAGGCVLIPCYPSGVVYDLFECLSTHLDKSGFSQVPLFFISPVAETSLAYSNILAEWYDKWNIRKFLNMHIIVPSSV